MFGLFRVRSPLLAESLLFSLPVGTEMVHFPTLSSTAYGFSGGSFGISQRGFPHSEIPGSKLVCSSPGLIAAYRVLHRLLAPRHSPYALSSLTIRNSNSRRDVRARHRSTWHQAPLRAVSCTLRVSGRKNLPFAGYSVVKDHSGGIRPSEFLRWSSGLLPPDPPSLSRSRAPKPRSAPSRCIFQRPSNLHAERGLQGPPRGEGAR